MHPVPADIPIRSTMLPRRHIHHGYRGADPFRQRTSQGAWFKYEFDKQGWIKPSRRWIRSKTWRRRGA